MKYNSINDLLKNCSEDVKRRAVSAIAQYNSEVVSFPINQPEVKNAPKTATSQTALDGRKREFEQQCQLAGIELETEIRFCPTRRWRADYQVRGTKILVEYEGKISGADRENSGHLSYKGYKKDIAKYNEAAIRGYTLIRIYAEAVKTGEALQWLERALMRK